MALAISTDHLSGQTLIAGLKRIGVDFVLSVPDISTSASLLRPISTDTQLKLVRVCKEDEGVSICAALSFCDKRAVLLMQQTGLMDSLNALRAVGMDYRNPVCMVIGLLGHVEGTDPDRSPSYGVRVIRPVLDAMGIRHHVLNSDDDIEAGMNAIEQAYCDSVPVALLLGRIPQ